MSHLPYKNGVIPKTTIDKLKFDIKDSDLLGTGGNNVQAYGDYLQKIERDEFAKNKPGFKGFESAKPGWFPTGEQNEGPFEMTPDLAQVRIVHSVGLVMKDGAFDRTEIKWPSIVNSLANKELRDRLLNLSAVQTLPASVKIAAATVGDNIAYRDMCHVQVFDGSNHDPKRRHGEEQKKKGHGKIMNTNHLYQNPGNGRPQDVGYPLHLLTEEGGFVLEEPPQLTDTFKHYWYISNSMLTSCAYKQESSNGTYISIPKNSDAARLMYYVLVIKNGMGAADQTHNVTHLDAELFSQSFNDNNDAQSWRFPEVTFNEVSSLLQSKLADVRSKSFDCTTIGVEVEAFDVFREHVFAGKGNIPVLITLEIDLHIPLARDAVANEIGGARHRSEKSDSSKFGADFE